MQNTSLKAYYGEIKPTLSERQKEVLAAFDKVNEFTHKELAKFLNWEINTVTPRVGELVAKGVLKDAYQRKCHITGRTAHVWTLSDTPVKPTSENEIVRKFLEEEPSKIFQKIEKPVNALW